jgi:tetratricopeptide (TPR) repeat protein
VSQSDFVTRGQSLVAAGQYQEAVKVCRLGLLGRPTTVEGRVVLGQALLALKRYDEVLAEMRVALELDHTSISAQVLKGEALLRKGDAHGAVEVLQRVRAQAPTDLQIAELLAEAEKVAGRPRLSAVHPSVGFVSQAASAPPAPSAPNPFATKAYVPHAADDEEDTGPEEDTEGSFTRPTSLSAPAAKKRSTPQPVQNPQLFGGAAAPKAGRRPLDETPPPNVLAVGDRSGTVEVDPELDGVEVDDDFGEPAAPPPGGKRVKPDGRGAVLPGARSPKAQPVKAAKKRGPQKEISTVELDDDEMVELDETFDPIPVKKGQSPMSAVRAAVKMPSGPLRTSDEARPISPAANRPTQHQPVPQPPAHLAALIANQPNGMQNQRSQLAAALPTVAAAMPAPPPGYPMPAANPFAQTMMPPAPSPAAALPTMALPPAPGQLSAAQMQSAAAVDAMFAQGDPFGIAAANEPTAQPHPPPVNPALAAMFDNIPAVSANDSMISQSNAKAMKTGIRRRSRLVITLWAFLGILVIGIGVGAGLWIRKLRLEKQIENARKEAVDLAKADTWKGWSGARDRLAGIAQASSTVDNRAALARTRALVAYEFGDGYPEAKQAIDGLGETGGLDAKIAAVYVALSQGNTKAARAAAETAVQTSADDAAVMFAQGNALLAAGDTKAAISAFKKAAEKEVRPLYLVGLARAYQAATMWDEAIQSTDRAIALTPDHPAGLIERAALEAKAGRILSSTTLGSELRGQLERVVSEGMKPPADQARGVSPAQVAFANLALARVDYARGDVNAAQMDVKNALAINHDELRFAEEVVETVYTTGSLAQARTAAETVLEKWPDSRRARVTLAEVFLAQGKNIEALETLAKLPETQFDPRTFAVRAKAKLANSDREGAEKDFDEALKRSPTLEPALVGRAWLELGSDPKDVDAARKLIEPRIKDNAPPPPALAAVYAAVLRASGDAADLEKAKGVLENAVKGAKSLDTARAQLELARLYRSIGGRDELRQARAAYEAANALPEARFESALLLIEDRDPRGGREALESLLKDAGDKAQAPLLVEVARARMLVGDHEGASALFPQIEKAQGLVKWQLERERGRYALRKGDYAGAVQQLAKALEDCGDDAETFLLAADAASDGEKQSKLMERVKTLAPKKLAGRPEAKIIEGKIALVEGDNAAARKAYEEATKEFGEKATMRRIAQATYGKGVSAYYQKDDPNARIAFELVIEQDPSIFSAYLFLGDMVKEKDPKAALELARKSVTYNPDFVEGWVMLGTVASRLRDRKQKLEAITRVGELAPNSDALRALQSLP